MLVDDRTVVREGLKALIEQENDLTVLAHVGSLDAARQLDVKPDVVLAEVDLPDAKHDAVVSGLHDFFPETPILVLTMIGHPSKVQAALAAGAAGYMLKTAASIDLLTGLRTVARGESYLQPSLGVDLARWHRPRDTSRELSPKEEQVLWLLVLGHTNAEIARQCGVSLRTVETHRARIHQKLGRRSKAELVQYAREVGLVGPVLR